MPIRMVVQRPVRIPLLVVVALVVAAVAASCSGNAGRGVVSVNPSRAVAGPASVILYGDSLAWETQDTFVQQSRAAGIAARVKSFGGLALCDALPALRTDVATRHPDAVLLEFFGNSFTPCMRDGSGNQLAVGSPAYYARWEADIRAAADAASAAGVRLVWATDPAPRNAPLAANLDELRTIAASVLDGRPGASVADTGAAVLDDGRYTDTLPCLPGEGPAQGCTAGRIRVRAPDGTHFCPVDPHAVRGVVGVCPVYSSGAQRFASALVDAARRAA